MKTVEVGCQVHSVEKTLDSSQLLLQPTLFKSSELNLLPKVVFFVLQPKDVFVQRSDVSCNQISSGNLRTEVIVVVGNVECLNPPNVNGDLSV